MIKNKTDAHKMLMLLPPPPPQLQAATVACKAAISVWTFWKMKINCSLCSKELVLKYYSVLTYKMPYVSKELPFKSGAIKSSEHPSLCSSKTVHRVMIWRIVMHLLKTLLHKQAFQTPFDTKMTGRVCTERNYARLICVAYSNNLILLEYKVISSLQREVRRTNPWQK